jgi:UDP-N-acetylglucosamine 4,6-dehydratase
MTRFWITLQDSVHFVLSSAASMRGGEIFVPKLYSSRLTDLAKALAPHLPQRIVGIRPGEKLHEALITADDARHTIELQDRFVILPSIKFWSDDSYDDLPRVRADFEYKSDNKDALLSEEHLRLLLRDADLLTDTPLKRREATASV